MKIYAISQYDLEDAYFRYTRRKEIIPDSFAYAFGMGWLLAKGLNPDENSFQFYNGIVNREMDVEY